MRRLVLTAAVLTSTVTGTVAALTQVAHAAEVCVSAHLNVNGSDVVNQQQCLPPQ